MELNYKVFGEGDPVIILHGLFGMLDNWKSFARKLAQDFSVYIIDQRNHGHSPHLPSINYHELSEDLHFFMDYHWIEKAHLIGHSMGGKTVMQFALDHPEKVDKLISIDIAPGKNRDRHTHIMEELLRLDLGTYNARNAMKQDLQLFIENQDVLQFLLKNLSFSREVNSFKWKMNLPVLYEYLEDILASVEARQPYPNDILFVLGENSDYVNDEDKEHTKKIFPAARFEMIENAGHWVQADQPTVLLEIIKSYLMT
jgi:pimeloyl-ACP methyl ester carboxylesterase